jgi:protease IV
VRKRHVLLPLAVALAACHGRPRTWIGPQARETHERPRLTSGEPAVVEIDLTRGAPEEPASGFFASPSGQSFFQLVSAVRQLSTDDSARGVFVRLGASHLGWARAEELGSLLGKIREHHKKVVCHADGYNNATYWMAARGCDRIWVSQAGEVELVGIAAQVVYAHRLLSDKLGIDIDFLQVGKYKGAEEAFTRDGPSPEARASLEGVLGAIRTSWLDGLAGARGAGARSVAEDGPYTPETGRRRGLVDGVGDVEEARRDAKKLGGADRTDVRFGGSSHSPARPDIGELVHTLAGGKTSWGGSPHVSVLRAVGAIAMDSGGTVLGERAGITERGLGRLITKLADDASAKAIVLRIDSPGGSALASDLLWQKLMALRKKKPIVISVGDMAASGGYYLASAGTRILAEPTSIVGSIGVVGGKLSFGRALEQIGVHVETFVPLGGPSAQARAAYASPLATWDAGTRARVLESMTAVYELFVRRVSEGRGITIEQAMNAAEGRIFAGAAAEQARLIDEWGGLERAITVAKELGKLPDEAPVRLVDQPSGIWELLDGEDDAEPGDFGSKGGSALVSLPGASGLMPFVASIRPLFRGEHAIAALPFALLLD